MDSDSILVGIHFWVRYMRNRGKRMYSAGI